MRVEPDRQDGHFSSDTPACHRCGVPLLEETRFCPYCERWIDDPADPRPRRDGNRATDRGLGALTERALLTAGFVFFAAVAVLCITAALIL